MQFVDTHHHLWDLENNSYPWLKKDVGHFAGDYSKIRRSYLISNFLADAASLPKDWTLVKSVHVQAEWDHEKDPVGETAWLQKTADSPGSRRPSQNSPLPAGEGKGEGITNEASSRQLPSSRAKPRDLTAA